MLEAPWFFAESRQTKEWQIIESDKDFLPRVGDVVPAAWLTTYDPDMKGEWVVRLVFDKKQQALMELLKVIDHYDHDGGSWMVVENLVKQAIQAYHEARLPKHCKKAGVTA
jgi:hypothetical protein